MQLPQTLVHWLLTGSATTAIIFFGAGLTGFFETPRKRPAWVSAIHDVTLVLSLVHLAGTVLLPPRSEAWAAVGIVLYSVAVAVFLSAIEAARRTRLQRAFVDEPHPDRLITDGPFRYVRHPFYVGYIAGSLAAPVAVNSVVLSVLAAAMISLTVVAAFREERLWLSSPRGEAYREYQRHTGMFIPFVGRRR